MSRLNNMMVENAISAAVAVIDTTTKNTDATAYEVDKHNHPPQSRTNPSARFRRGGATFTTAANTQAVVLGLTASPVTYTFKTALGSPAASNVEVKVQASVALTIALLARAIRGENDAVNIAYGTGTQPHPDVLGYYEPNNFSIGTTQHAAGANLYVKEKVGDQTDAAKALTFSSTATSTVTAFTRVFNHRYIFSGNHATLNSRVAGAYQMVIPIGSSLHTDGVTPVKYDVNMIVTENVVSASRIIEADIYYSLDGVNFTMLSYGLNLSKDNTSAGSQIHPLPNGRPPLGAGLYVKMRSDGTQTTDWVEYKVQLHQYPPGV